MFMMMKYEIIKDDIEEGDTFEDDVTSVMSHDHDRVEEKVCTRQKRKLCTKMKSPRLHDCATIMIIM